MAGILVVAGIAPAMADKGADSAPVFYPTQPVSASAALDFNIKIGKFIYFRVGSGVFPSASSTVDTVSFTTKASFPSNPVDGNSVAANWNGAVPVFTSTADAVLPVEVRSNAGQISLRASVVSPLSNGSEVIPFSNVHIVSSDSNLPAPPIPNSGSGTAVNVAGTSFANLVTQRTANWTFSYVGSGASTAGSFNGTVMFTASSL